MRKNKALPALLLSLATLASPVFAVDEELPAEENMPPVAENQQLETYRGVSVGGRLEAYDPEGGAVTFHLAAEPIKGTVELTEDGYFIYTPKENKRGKDYFSFTAEDDSGNVSQEGTVIIKLLRQSSSVTYSDMAGSPAEYAAVALTEKGVFTGESLGGDHVFAPDSPVTRGEFLTMCMNAADCGILKGVSSTGFQDDDDIGGWLKPYVATALMQGYIRGTAVENGAVFRPDDEITLRDACVMLNAVLGVTDVVSAAALEGEEPVEGAQAVANLTSAGVLTDSRPELGAALTRADAAELLQNAMSLLAKR